MLIYAYIGVEMVAVTASEARDAKQLRWPSMIIAYFTSALYLLCVIGELLDLKWSNWDLPLIYGGRNTHYDPKPPHERGIVVLATLEAHHPTMASLINGSLIYSALSAANTSLYVSSRTLYGMTRTMDARRLGWFSRLGTVWHRNQVPMFAVLFSAIAFIWLPIIHLRSGYTIVNVGIGSCRGT